VVAVCGGGVWAPVCGGVCCGTVCGAVCAALCVRGRCVCRGVVLLCCHVVVFVLLYCRVVVLLCCCVVVLLCCCVVVLSCCCIVVLLCYCVVVLLCWCVVVVCSPQSQLKHHVPTQFGLMQSSQIQFRSRNFGCNNVAITFAAQRRTWAPEARWQVTVNHSN